MATVTDGLTPPLVWKYFSEISAIPRGSKNEAAIAKYVMQTAKRLGLPARQDKAGSVLVRKPASPGREQTPSVCLQGHLDMVCEKTPETKHDFLKDPLELKRVDGFLMANGTTLGADNGIAVATNLAIMEDKGLTHGPLEFLFTVDEETGLTGASHLEPGFVQQPHPAQPRLRGRGRTVRRLRRRPGHPGPLARAVRTRAEGQRGLVDHHCGPARRALRASRSTRTAATRSRS